MNIAFVSQSPLRLLRFFTLVHNPATVLSCWLLLWQSYALVWAFGSIVQQGESLDFYRGEIIFELVNIYFSKDTVFPVGLWAWNGDQTLAGTQEIHICKDIRTSKPIINVMHNKVEWQRKKVVHQGENDFLPLYLCVSEKKLHAHFCEGLIKQGICKDIRYIRIICKDITLNSLLL